MKYDDQNRRPMRLRQDSLVKRICFFLGRLGVNPNVVSIFIFIFSLLASVLLVSSVYFKNAFLLFYSLSILCIGLRLMCSLLDGMLAIEMGKKEFDGDLYNELPEIASDFLLFCSVGWILQSEVPWGLSLGLCVSWLSLATAFIRRLGTSLVGKPYFIGVMGKLNRMIVLVVGLFLQSIVLSLDLASYNILLITFIIIALGCIQTIFIRIKSVRADLKKLSDKASTVHSVKS